MSLGIMESHGTPKIWMYGSNPTEENAVRIISDLKDFGFESLGIQVSDLIVPEQTIQLGYPPIRIDILTSVDGVDFSGCYPARIRIVDSGVSIDVIDREGLKKNKKASGRPQDMANLEHLQEV